MVTIHRPLAPVPVLGLVFLLLSIACAQNTESTAGVTAASDTYASNLTVGPVPTRGESLADDGTVTPPQSNDDSKRTVNSHRNTLPVTGDTVPKVSTTGIPDVTATSQRIVLLTTGHSEDNRTDGQQMDSTPTAETSAAQQTDPPSTARPMATESSTDVTNTTQVVTATPLQLSTGRPSDATSAPHTTADLSGAVDKRNLTGPTAPTRTSTAASDFTVEGNATVNGKEASGTTGDTRTVQLTFYGTCDYDMSSITDQLHALTRANVTVLGLDGVSCRREIKVRLPVSDPDGGLDSMVGVFRLRTRETVLTLSAVEFLDRTPVDDGFVPRIFEAPFSTREIITYAVVGGIFGVAIVLVAALLCCKCCCGRGGRTKRRSEDIPHLTLRLEDYSLTRIPRPATLFPGEGGAPVRNGATGAPRLSIDTSVVPIEENFGSLQRGELRSFSGRRLRHRAAAESEDDARSRCSPALTGSTERLARDFGNRQARRGNENKNFRF